MLGYCGSGGGGSADGSGDGSGVDGGGGVGGQEGGRAACGLSDGSGLDGGGGPSGTSLSGGGGGEVLRAAPRCCGRAAARAGEGKTGDSFVTRAFRRSAAPSGPSHYAKAQCAVRGR